MSRNNYLTQGIHVQEIGTFPGMVAEVASAVPAFMGYTERIRHDGRDLQGVPELIRSFKDFEERFGGAAHLYLDAVKIKTTDNGTFSSVDSVQFKKRFLLHEAVYMYFANGGGDCYIVSTGSYSNGEHLDKKAFLEAIEALESVDDVTLLAMPEAVMLDDSLYEVQQAALAHCAKRMNRFAVLDVKETAMKKSSLLDWRPSADQDSWKLGYQEFRDRIGISNLSYGAAYTPFIVADTPVTLEYRHIKDFLFDADRTETTADGQTAPLKLALPALDPLAEKSVQSLDSALRDQSGLLNIVDEAVMTLLGQKSEDTATVLLPDAVKKVNTPFTAESLAKSAGVYARIFAAILGVDQKDIPLAGDDSMFNKHAMSTDIVQHALDCLKTILLRVEAFAGAPGNGDAGGQERDAAALLNRLYEILSTLTEGHFNEAQVLFQGLLFDDLYSAVSKNIARLDDGLHGNSMVYRSLHSAVQTAMRVQPPSAAMAGIYASTDRQRGVWKAPANVSISAALGLTQVITADTQEKLNSDSVAGKSINALRSFPGKGFLVWGARTLDGNSMEWRYIPVRRFFIMVEESIRRATAQAVFEPNEAFLWARVKSLIDNYLLQKWKDGALMGAASAEAYFVNVGLGSTMTEQDILEGRLIVEVGMAVVRPAEFIILRFMHKMQQA